MQVKAIRVGYYGNKRRKEGERFALKDPKHFSKAWMEKVSGKPAPVEPEPEVEAGGGSDGEVI